MQPEVSCGNWDPNTKKNNFKVWQRLPSDLDIHQVSSAKVWGTVSNRNALVRLETIISRHLLCATGAQCTPQKNSQPEVFGRGFWTSIILISPQSKVPPASVIFQLKSSNTAQQGLSCKDSDRWLYSKRFLATHLATQRIYNSGT